MPWFAEGYEVFFTLHFFFLSLKAKNRGIAIPVDLDSQVNTLFMKSHSNMVQRAAMGWRMSARSGPRFKEALGGPAWDYRNIIEKLQVQNVKRFGLVVAVHLSVMCQLWKTPQRDSLPFKCWNTVNLELLGGGSRELSSCLVPVQSRFNTEELLIHDLNSTHTEVSREGLEVCFCSLKWSTEKDLLSALSQSHVLFGVWKEVLWFIGTIMSGFFH